MVRDSVPRVLWVPAAHDREPVQFFRHARAEFGKVDAGNGSLDHTERAANAVRRKGFWVEGIMVTGATLGPDKDAIDLGVGFATVGEQSRWIQEARDRQARDAGLQDVASMHCRSMHCRLQREGGESDRVLGWRLPRDASRRVVPGTGSHRILHRQTGADSEPVRTSCAAAWVLGRE